jgi:hypothetical protein
MKINYKEIIRYAYLIKSASKLMRKYKEKGNIVRNVTSYFLNIFPEIKFYQKSNVQLFIFKNKNQTIFLFPESYGSDDWYNNFNFIKKRGYHRGFLKQYRKVEQIIIANINEKEKNVVLGWSLGGAIATIMSSKWSGYNLKFYTFGQPRAVNYRIAKKVNKWHKKNYFRIVNINDPVCKVPFKLFFPSSWWFWHVGTKIKIGKNKFLIKILKFWKWRKWFYKEQMNHHIDEYIRLIECGSN